MEGRHLSEGASEHDLDRIGDEGRLDVAHGDEVGVRRVQRIRGESPGAQGRGLDDQPAFSSSPAMKNGARASLPAEADRPASNLTVQGNVDEDLASFDDERAVVQDEGQAAAELVGHSSGGRETPARHENDAGSDFAGPIERLPYTRRDRLVAAQKGAVDIEGDETKGQRPAQISTLSMTSPGRMRSTTSIPPATWPKMVYPPSRCGVGTWVMKNWLPPVSFPESAIPTAPRP
jgi:hypothetical protein